MNHDRKYAYMKEEPVFPGNPADKMDEPVKEIKEKPVQTPVGPLVQVKATV